MCSVSFSTETARTYRLSGSGDVEFRIALPPIKEKSRTLYRRHCAWDLHERNVSIRNSVRNPADCHSSMTSNPVPNKVRTRGYHNLAQKE